MVVKDWNLTCNAKAKCKSSSGCICYKCNAYPPFTLKCVRFASLFAFSFSILFTHFCMLSPHHLSYIFRNSYILAFFLYKYNSEFISHSDDSHCDCFRYWKLDENHGKLKSFNPLPNKWVYGNLLGATSIFRRILSLLHFLDSEYLITWHLCKTVSIDLRKLFSENLHSLHFSHLSFPNLLFLPPTLLLLFVMKACIMHVLVCIKLEFRKALLQTNNHLLNIVGQERVWQYKQKYLYHTYICHVPWTNCHKSFSLHSKTMKSSSTFGYICPRSKWPFKQYFVTSRGE